MTIANTTAWAETIKDVPEFPGYRVSDVGRVFSNKKRGRRRFKGDDWYEMAVCRTSVHGHLSVKLWKAGRYHWKHVHGLVLEAFVGPCHPGMEGCHFDGNPANNCVANLRWDTRQANAQDSVRHGTQVTGSRVGTSKLDESEVIRLRARYAEIPNKLRLAAEFGISRKTVQRIVERKTWAHVS